MLAVLFIKEHLLKIFCLISLFSAFTTQAVFAETVVGNIASTKVNIVLPDGHCLLQETNPVDARLIKPLKRSMANRNKLILAFSDCRQLADWRAGKKATLDDFGQYLTPLNTINQTIHQPRSKIIGAICGTMRKMPSQRFNALSREAKRRVEENFEGVKINSQKFIGVLYEDDSACFFGVLQKIRTEHGKIKKIIGVIAITSAKGKIVFMNFFTLSKKDALTRLLEKQKRNVSRFLNANN